MSIKFDFKDENLNNLWIDYQEKRERGLKKEANRILNRVIKELEQRNYELKNGFVKTLLGKIYEEGIEFELQYLILKKIILPVLIDELKKKNMPAIRWLYQIPYIDMQSISEIESLVDEGEVYEELLLLALEIDSEDKTTQKLIIKYYIDYLGYSIHEIPFGLLCKIEEGLLVISKAYDIVNKSKFDYSRINKTKEVLNLFEILITEWKNYKSQNTISNFHQWCDLKKFDYVECMTKIDEIS